MLIFLKLHCHTNVIVQYYICKMKRSPDLFRLNVCSICPIEANFDCSVSNSTILCLAVWRISRIISIHFNLNLLQLCACVCSQKIIFIHFSNWLLLSINLHEFSRRQCPSILIAMHSSENQRNVRHTALWFFVNSSFCIAFVFLCIINIYFYACRTLGIVGRSSNFLILHSHTHSVIYLFIHSFTHS